MGGVILEIPEQRKPDQIGSAIRTVDGQLWLANVCLGPMDSPFARHMLATFETFVQTLQDEYGPSALISTRSSAAIHEIGHAVIFRSLGESLRSVRLQCRNGEWCGFCDGGGPFFIGNSSSPEEEIKQALITIAGFIAERSFHFTNRWSSVDEQFMALIYIRAAAKKLNVEHAALRQACMSTLMSIFAANKKTIIDAAAVLVKERRLKGVKFANILKEVTVSPTIIPDIILGATMIGATHAIS